jgi:hypothetical protein
MIHGPAVPPQEDAVILGTQSPNVTFMNHNCRKDLSAL